MSQKKNGREFSIELDDDDDYLDFGSDDDFDNMENVHNLTLAELIDRDELRNQARVRREQEEREEARVRREREAREERRSQTQENTLSNSGGVIIFFVYYFSSQKL